MHIHKQQMPFMSEGSLRLLTNCGSSFSLSPSAMPGTCTCMGVESMFPGRGSIVDLSRGGQNDYSRRAKSGQVSFNVLETKSTPSDALVYPFRRPCAHKDNNVFLLILNCH